MQRFILTAPPADVVAALTLAPLAAYRAGTSVGDYIIEVEAGAGVARFQWGGDAPVAGAIGARLLPGQCARVAVVSGFPIWGWCMGAASMGILVYEASLWTRLSE